MLPDPAVSVVLEGVVSVLVGGIEGVGLDLANAIKRWKRSGFSKEQRASEYAQLLNKYAPLLSFESWIITSWFVVPRVSPKVTTRVFWVPSIVLYWSVIEILSSSEHRFE